jgi:DNA repair photolyase
LDLLTKINAQTKCVVQTTMTTFDEELCTIIEPNVCGTKRRFEVLTTMRDAGIPTVVWLSPFLPFINDTEENIRGLLDYCVEAGVRGIVCFGIGLTLREGNREYFYTQLDKHFPGLKQKYQQTYGNAYMIGSANNDTLMKLVHETCAKHGILCGPDAVFEYLRTFEEKSAQGELF